MVAQLNALDLGILLILGLGLIYGLSRGALRMATPIVSFACGIYAGSLWYGRAGALVQRNFETSPATGQVAGYAIVFLLAFVVVGYAAGRIIELAHIINLNWIDRVAGGAFGIAIAASFAGLDVLLLTALLPATSPLLLDSQLAPRALAYNETLIGFIPPEVKQLYFEKRGQLYHLWAEKAAKLEPKSDSSK
ncbi:MAG TPA: CvpA family protein [Candidatus Binataceae bacterium]|nr:CvpA family protein [Candidatus Binataceae bacterium]